MIDWLWLVPALPFAGFVLLALFGGRLRRAVAAWIGVGSVGLSAAVAFGVAASFFATPPAGGSVVQTLWRWFDVTGLSPSIGLYLDPLAIVMMLVVTGVGFLIHLYSAEFMADDEAFSRFFAYMNLFLGAMLLLVLADNLVLLYLGWEGVGLCSYLLIGFWYTDPANGRAARKAFIVTRIGDTAMAIGLFLLYSHLGTLDIQRILIRADGAWPVGSGLAIAAAVLLLGGAVGKSAQLPLQTWLPDAMAGPTPVSALIHAATMVTAGVYLIARTHTLFELAPPVLAAVAVIGAATLLVAAFAALAQRDIKRVLAYSTISQIGYMFLALGVGAWSAAIFHLMTHAFFKALLFLGAGSVILACHHEHDIFEMGGLKDRMPVTFWTFVAAGSALAGVPLVTAGFYSKDLILSKAFEQGAAGGGSGGVWLWAAGLFGAFLTALYIFRVIFIAFFGEVATEPERRPRWRMAVPLVVLGLLALVGGFVEVPNTLGGFHGFTHFLDPVFARPEVAAAVGHGAGEPGGGIGLEVGLELLAALASLGGIALAWAWFRPAARRPARSDRPGGEDPRARLPFISPTLQDLWARGWAFDTLYGALIVKPYTVLAARNKGDVIDWLVHSIAAVIRGGHRALAKTQTGRLRWYAAGVALGAIVLLGLLVGWLALGAPSMSLSSVGRGGL